MTPLPFNGWCLWVVLVVSSVSVGETVVEPAIGGVRGMSPDRREVWTLTHPRLGRNAPVGPVTLNGRVFYAIDWDVIEVDAENGTIRSRTYFPARIAELTVHETRIAATLELEGVRQPRAQVKWKPGDPPPGRGRWSGGLGTSLADARGWAQPEGSGWESPKQLRALPVEKRTHVAAKLRTAMKQDPSNPFLSFYLGCLLAEEGRVEEAKNAFAQASAGSAPWIDLFFLSRLLDEAGAEEEARRAFERGFADMEARGVRPERCFWLGPAFLLSSQETVALAITQRNYARVDEIMGRIVQVAPQMPYGREAWTALADWFSREGQAQPASSWRQRAATAKHGQGLTPTWEETIQQLAWLQPLAIGLFCGTLLISFAAHIRVRGLKLASVPILDSVTILLWLAASCLLCVSVAWRRTMIGLYATMPVLPIAEDGLASPEAQSWLLANLGPSPARDRLCAEASAEAIAAAEGGRAPDTDLDLPTLLAQALAEPRDNPWSLEYLGREQSKYVLGYLLVLLLTSTAACELGKRLPGTRYLAWVIPGGAASCRPFGGLVAGAVGGAVAFFATPVNQRVFVTVPIRSLFGMEQLPGAATSAPTIVWPWVLLCTGLVVHALTVLIDVRRGSLSSKTSGPPAA